MTLKQHLAATGLAAPPLLVYTGVYETVLFCIGSILIDLDHLLFYFIRKRKWDVGGMFRYFREEVDPHLHETPYLGVCILHTAEFFLVIAGIAAFLPPVRFLLAGMTLHILMDIYDLIRLKVPFIRAYSLLEHLVRRRQSGYPFR